MYIRIISIIMLCFQDIQRAKNTNNLLEYENEENFDPGEERVRNQEFASNDLRDGGGGRRIKVEKLGNTLRSRVSKLRSRDGVDLVFLVDSSASVGSQNFYNEIKFIRKVLYFSESL